MLNLQGLTTYTSALLLQLITAVNHVYLLYQYVKQSHIYVYHSVHHCCCIGNRKGIRLVKSYSNNFQQEIWPNLE